MEKRRTLLKKGMSLLLVLALTVGMLTGFQNPLKVQAATAAEALASAIISASNDSGACTVSGDMVTMQKDVTMATTVTFSAGMATLNLNGHIMTGASGISVITLMGGTLTVDDTAGNGKIISHTRLHYGIGGITVTNSQLILQNGAIENPGVDGGSLCVYIGSNGIFDMYGGSLQAQSEYAIMMYASTAICNLYGGSAEGKARASILHSGKELNLKVPAGKEYTMKVNGMYSLGVIWQCENKTNLDCEGTVIFQNTGTSGYGVFLESTVPSFTIKNGTFIASGPLGAFSKPPVIVEGTTVTVYAGADESTAVLVENPTSTTYTSNQYVKIIAVGPTYVSSAAISGVIVPVGGQTPNTSAISSDLGVGEVSNVTWTKADGSTFTGSYGFNTAYKASVTLTPSSHYAFDAGITASNVTVNGSTATSVTKNGDGTLTVTYTFPATAKAKLQSITAPNAVTGVTNGTDLGSIILPTTVNIVTEDASVTAAAVSWVRTPANGTSYNTSTLTEQTFTLNGTVTCPTGIDQNAISLTTSISVTVSEADQVEAPIANITAGTYAENQNIQLSSATAGATIYYTTDGSIPTTSSSLYSSAIPVTGAAGQNILTTIKAMAVKNQMRSSGVSTYAYMINLAKYNTTLSLVEAPTSQADYPSDVTLTASLVNVDSLLGKTITFYDGENILETKTTDSTGKASCTVISPAAGAHDYKAVFTEETANKGATSNIISYTINKATQGALSFGATIPNTKTYGATAFMVTATGGNGTGGISYTSSNESVATVDPSSGTVNIVGTGKFTITATKEADSNYKAASVTSGEITVNPKVLTVSVEDVTIKYGENLPNLIVNVSGFVNNDTMSGLIGFQKPTASVSGAVDTTDTTLTTLTVAYSGGDATHNYTFDLTKTTAKITVSNVVVTDEDYSVDHDINQWQNSAITITPQNGYTQISKDKIHWNATLILEENGTNQEIVYLKNVTTGVITEAKTINYKLDTVAPTGEITVNTNSFKNVINTITFDTFCKNMADMTITGMDDTSGIAKVEYQKVANGDTYDVNGTWTTYVSKQSYTQDETFVIYAKITDHAGNITIINTNGIVVYHDSALNTSTAEFYMNKQQDISVTVNWNHNTLTSIKNGLTTLIKDTNYTVSDSTITIKKEYLESALTGDSLTLTFEFAPMGVVSDQVSIKGSFTVTKNKEMEELTNTKNTEKAAIDSKTIEAKGAIDAMTNLTVSEKKTAKEEVDSAAALAKTAIDAATDTEGVTTTRINGVRTIEGKVSDAVKTGNVNRVTEKIIAISETTIQAARAAYNGLTDAEKALIPAVTLKKLTDAEAAYNKAKETASPAKETAKPAATISVKDQIAAAKKNNWVNANVSLINQVITTQKINDNLEGSLFKVLQAKASQTTKNTNTLTWKKISGADGYIIYGKLCGTKYKYQKITTAKTSTKYVHKNLKKGTYYKYILVAYKLVDGKQKVLTVSKTMHSATDGGKVGNAKSVKVNKTKVTLKLKQTAQIKAKEVKKSEKISKHRGFAYESSNSKIATVSAKGVIQAKSKGKCTIYTYAQNGICKGISVTVK